MSLVRANGFSSIDVALVTIKPANSTNEYALDTASHIEVKPVTEKEDAKKLIVKGKMLAQKPEQITLTGNDITLTDNVFTPEVVKATQGGTIHYGTTSFVAGADSLAIGVKNPETPTTVTIIKPDTASATLSVSASGNDVTINLATDASKVSTSTAAQVKAAIDGSALVSALITCTVVGTGTGLVAAVAKTTVSNKVVGYTPPAIGDTTVIDPCSLSAYSAQYDEGGSIVRYECITYPNCKADPVAFSSEDGKFRAPEFTLHSLPPKGSAPFDLSYVDTLPAITEN